MWSILPLCVNSKTSILHSWQMDWFDSERKNHEKESRYFCEVCGQFRIHPSTISREFEICISLVAYVYERYWYFVLYSQDIAKVGTSLFQSFTFHNSSLFFNENYIQRCLLLQKNNYYPSYFHVNWHMICSNYFFFLFITLLNFKYMKETSYIPFHS